MVYIFLFFYTVFYIFIVIPLFCVASIWNLKFREGLKGRFSQASKLKNFIAQNKGKEIIFFHSASVGEWEQSIPIIKELKKHNSNIAILASFFSPSGMHHAKKEDIDCSIYLPFDIIFLAIRFFKQIQPKVWIISKYDVWPGFVFAAFYSKVPVLLCSAELAEDSTRYKGIFAKINRLFYRYLAYIFPISEEYKQRFLNMYPYPDRMHVTGDARYDQIYQKAEIIKEQESVQLFTNSLEITCIAGSIWPADEKHVLPAFIRIYKEHSNVQFILVPHELHESHLKDIESAFSKENIQTERYSNFISNGTSTCNVIIINTIGILAKLYKISDIAYVGGAFSTGVHNVAEPAVFENPVVFGPKYINSFEAVQIQKLQGGFSICNEQECYTIFKNLIVEVQARKNAGVIAQNFIASNKGATQKIVSVIQNYL